MTIRTWTTLCAGLTGFALLGEACRFTEPNPLHCFNNEGDEYCRARNPARPYCERGQDECITPGSDYGCVVERPADECYSPCGGRSTIDEDGACVMMESSSTGSSSGGTETVGSESSSESSTTGRVPCVSDEECLDPAAPFCEAVGGECVACDGTKDPDGACAGVDPLRPLCVGGACVACTPENPAACTGTTPICDGETNACVPCVVHDQCGGAACNLYTGACLPADRVFEVGGPMADYPNLNMALADQAPDTETTFIVHPGMPDYNEAVVVDQGRTVAFLAAEIGPSIEPPQWVQTSGAMPQLTVAAGTTVLMDGMRLSANTSAAVPGLLADGGRAWVDRSRIVQNSGGGVLAQNGAELTLRNSFVGGGLDVDALTLDASSIVMLYTTVGGGAVLGGRARALFCQGATVADVRNSILVSGDPMPEVECPNATLTNSATETDVGMLDVTWFTGYATGDLHLSPAGAKTFADVAQWQAGDPTTDIDGDLRPDIDGTPDYAGADVP